MKVGIVNFSIKCLHRPECSDTSGGLHVLAGMEQMLSKQWLPSDFPNSDSVTQGLIYRGVRLHWTLRVQSLALSSALLWALQLEAEGPPSWGLKNAWLWKQRQGFMWGLSTAAWATRSSPLVLSREPAAQGVRWGQKEAWSCVSLCAYLPTHPPNFLPPFRKCLTIQISWLPSC